jgi:hypothetical protein
LTEMSTFCTKIQNFQGVLSWGFPDVFRKNEINSMFTTYRSNF